MSQVCIAKLEMIASKYPRSGNGLSRSCSMIVTLESFGKLSFTALIIIGEISNATTSVFCGRPNFTNLINRLSPVPISKILLAFVGI